MGINFPMTSQTKISLSNGITSTRHFFLTEKPKDQNKGKSSGDEVAQQV